jgi:transcriptional regulator with XRE-family HTH domain
MLDDNDIRKYYQIINHEYIVHKKNISNISNNTIVIKAKSHYQLLNEVFQLSLKGCRSTTYNYKGNIIWFIRIDGKTRNGYKNEFSGEDIIETSTADHEPYKEKYRYIFQIVESSGDREYIYLGKYEYLINQSTQRRSFFKCLHDYGLINSYLSSLNQEVQEETQWNSFTNDVLFNKNKSISWITNVPVKNTTSFAEILEELQNKKNLTKYQVCKKCCIDKSQYNRLLGERLDSPANPTKETVYKICIGLELNYEEAMYLIEKAGFKNKDGDYLDMLIEHCLKYSYYNKDEIDSSLIQANYKPLFNTDTLNDYIEKNKNREVDITRERWGS